MNNNQKTDSVATKLSIIIACIACVVTWFSYDLIM